MINYFAILEIKPDAGKADIKKAYRTLAMRYHPDRNKDPNARAKFITINEAYEFLSTDKLRIQHKRQLTNKVSQEDLLQRKEEIYRQWVKQQRKKARQRAAYNANSSYEKFSESRIFKTAMVISYAYNYIFLAVGIAIICTPLFHYLTSTPQELQERPVTVFEVIITLIIGTAFTLGIYFFLFKNNSEEETS